MKGKICWFPVVLKYSLAVFLFGLAFTLMEQPIWKSILIAIIIATGFQIQESVK